MVEPLPPWAKAMFAVIGLGLAVGVVYLFLLDSGRIGEAKPADWRVDPSAQIGPADQLVPIIVNENACASGRSAEGRITVHVDYEPDVVRMDVGVRPVGGDVECPSNPDTRLVVALEEPLGDRTIVGERWPTAVDADEAVSQGEFWSSLSVGSALEYEQFASLAEMVEYADLIVVGEISRVVEGRAYEGTPGDVQHTASVTIDVAEVVRGDPIAPHQPQSVTFQRTYTGSLPTGDALPEARALVFLREAEALSLEVGRSQVEAERYRGEYVLVSSHGILVETSTGVHAPLRVSGEEGFLDDYSSDDLATVLAFVRSM